MFLVYRVFIRGIQKRPPGQRLVFLLSSIASDFWSVSSSIVPYSRSILSRLCQEMKGPKAQSNVFGLESFHLRHPKNLFVWIIVKEMEKLFFTKINSEWQVFILDFTWFQSNTFPPFWICILNKFGSSNYVKFGIESFEVIANL